MIDVGCCFLDSSGRLCCFGNHVRGLCVIVCKSVIMSVVFSLLSVPHSLVTVFQSLVSQLFQCNTR